MLLLIASCTRGLEDICAREIERLGGRVKFCKIGRVFFEGSEELIYKICYCARTVEKLFLFLHKGLVSDLNDAYKVAREIELPFSMENLTFGVETHRVGRHDFRSIDVSAAVGKAIKEKYDAKVYLDDPDVKFFCWLINDELTIAIDLTGTALHRRNYRVYQHPAPLNPCIASSLLYLAKFKQELLDPFCGSGTILIEAALMLCNVPPGKFRKVGYRFERLPIYDKEKFEKIKEKASKKVKERKGLLIGIEKFQKHINGAIENARSAHVENLIKFYCNDATRLHKLNLPKINLIVTNPPYGLRVANLRKIFELYEKFFKSLSKYNNNARLLFLCPHELEIEGLRKLRSIMYGDLRTYIYINF